MWNDRCKIVSIDPPTLINNPKFNVKYNIGFTY
jgi:hypothetical protein